ncbi:MAG: 3-oxoacyl-[acyl-carrier protein] reductase [Nocardioides sp.]|jgi:NAD(P)-dependent dehydrogenase (short-subunit alcohol dehydrogenase family)|nr:3-oxoacyl-[acyl-carrier protein] reductase [Nocardioides sp.]
MHRLQGRTAIITGASRGIGLAIAHRLVEEGARVCITARKPEALAAAVEELGGPDHAIFVAGKADDAEHQVATVTRTLAAYGSVDLLVNNTGINPVAGPLVDADLGAGAKIVGVNCLGTLSWVQTVYRAWMQEHGGSIVNISSVAGLKPAPGIGLYGASKAMLNHLTQGLALELAPTIRVNAVAPAVVKTRFGGPLYEGKEAEVAAAYPMARLGSPEDIAGAVAFLASEDAAWMTGHILVADGGLTMTGGV